MSDNETVNGMLDLQLNGIKTFYKALERNGKSGLAANRRVLEFSHRSLAGTRLDDEVAPTADLRAVAPERGGSTRSSRFWHRRLRALMQYNPTGDAPTQVGIMVLGKNGTLTPHL
jgi:hypothetical protein